MFLGLDGFPASKPVHNACPIGATSLSLWAAHIRARVEPFGAIPPLPTSTCDAQAEASCAIAGDADVRPPATSNDSNIQHTLDYVLTVQAAHGHILVDLLDEVRALYAELAHFRRSLSPPPFNDGS